MKINPGFRPLGKELMLSDQAAQPRALQPSFSEMLQTNNERHSEQQLNRMLQRIHEHGDRLSKKMTLRELRQYKLLVKQFLEETARRGIRIRESRGWDRRGRTKRYALLEEIDEQLLAMAEELLDTEAGKIDLLNKVGEIRGMLINLFY